MKSWMHILIVAALWAATSLYAANVSLIEIKGPIGPATASFIKRAIKIADERKDACLIIQLDTPGGLLDATKDIKQAFYDSKVPTVVYVSPQGADAASAGCFITMAADIAAMAPNTTIGAAHPISIGPGGTVEKEDDKIREKHENYAATMIEDIANRRGRNVEWARSAVLDSACITVTNALEKGVIDLIAADLPDLLKQLEGRKVGEHIIKTTDAQIAKISKTSQEKAFDIFLRPEVLFILMLVVTYGIIGELSTPGAILPGVAGAIALILVLFMSSILPVNLTGLALLGLAIILFIIDIFAPTHGVLTFGGIVAFFLGALMLFDRADPVFRLSLGYIIPGTLLTAVFFIFVVGAGLRAQRLPVRAGRETMLGKIVLALDRIDASGGKVFIEGELWNAVSDVPVAKDQPVEVVAVAGLTLKVKPKNQ